MLNPQEKTTLEIQPSINSRTKTKTEIQTEQKKTTTI